MAISDFVVQLLEKIDVLDRKRLDLKTQLDDLNNQYQDALDDLATMRDVVAAKQAAAAAAVSPTPDQAPPLQ